MIIKMSKQEYDHIRATVLKLTGSKKCANQVASTLYCKRLTQDIPSVLVEDDPWSKRKVLFT